MKRNTIKWEERQYGGNVVYKVDNKDRKKLYPIFKNMSDTLILSYIEGHMGEAYYVEDFEVALIYVNPFAFLAGDINSNNIEELLKTIPDQSLLVVENEKFEKLIEERFKDKANKFKRYAFVRDIKNFNYDYIKGCINKLPKDYILKKIDEEVLENESFYNLSEDFIINFESKEDFLKRGLGYVILNDNKVISGATSFSIYDEGIEIEIDTHKDYRQKGLATIVAAKLIIECLDKGIYPNWDAANLISVSLAEKLGYVLDKEYNTYYINLKDKE